MPPRMMNSEKAPVRVGKLERDDGQGTTAYICQNDSPEHLSLDLGDGVVLRVDRDKLEAFAACHGLCVRPA